MRYMKEQENINIPTKGKQRTEAARPDEQTPMEGGRNELRERRQSVG